MQFKSTFLALIGVQALHSLEEYVFELWAVFPPAQILTGWVSQDLERGFIIINVALVAFGACCYWWPVRLGWPSAVPLAWLWVVIELINGAGHPVWSVVQGGYTPGVVTAIVLLPLALLLAHQLLERVTRASTA